MESPDNTRLTRRRALIAGGSVLGALVVVVATVVWVSGDEPLTKTADAAIFAPVTTVLPTTTSSLDPDDQTASPIASVSIPTTTDLGRSTPTTTRPPRTPTSPTIELDRLPTLVQGDTGIEVLTFQRMLKIVTGADIAADGVFGPETAKAVEAFQRFVGFAPTGEADHETRLLLMWIDAGRSSLLPTWPLPTIGDGGADGCQVAVIGDSLMAGAHALHERRLAEIGCASAVDGVGGRSLAAGWQCREQRADGRRPLMLFPEPQPGNDTCAPSGLELLRLWSEAQALGDVVVIALGTNDATVFAAQRWPAHWNQAVTFAGGRPIVVVTTQGRPGHAVVPAQAEYSGALRQWCATVPTCVLADWALTPTANDPASYVDAVHLTSAATDARAAFIRDVVGALVNGRPIPKPTPLPTPTSTLPAATTSTTTSTTTSSTSTTVVAPTSTTTSTTAPATSTTSTTTTTSTSTTVAEPPPG